MAAFQLLQADGKQEASIWSLKVDKRPLWTGAPGMMTFRAPPRGAPASRASPNLFRHRPKRDRSPMRVRGEPCRGSGLAAGYGAATWSPSRPPPGPGGLPLRPCPSSAGSHRPGGRPDSGTNSASLSRRQARLVPSRSLEAGVSPCKCLPCSFQTWASCTQDGNLRSDRGLLVAGASESRTDVGREHSQTALFTGRVLSHHPTRCKDAFRCTLISHGPPNCISSTSAQYCSQRC